MWKDFKEKQQKLIRERLGVCHAYTHTPNNARNIRVNVSTRTKWLRKSYSLSRVACCLPICVRIGPKLNERRRRKTKKKCFICKSSNRSFPFFSDNITCCAVRIVCCNIHSGLLQYRHKHWHTIFFFFFLQSTFTRSKKSFFARKKKNFPNSREENINCMHLQCWYLFSERKKWIWKCFDVVKLGYGAEWFQCVSVPKKKKIVITIHFHWK